ncbi:MAG: DUF4394 domain-containing protein [Chitinophagaceae bacterium]|nr:DUF4394 domain-containing protein [Chitinophagaceae bacterium]
MNPETGTVIAVDAALNPSSLSVTGAAYTNSFSGSTATTLYTVDFLNRTLYKQDPQNSGLSTIIAGLLQLHWAMMVALIFHLIIR